MLKACAMPSNTILEMPLRDATPESVQDWQLRFPNATLRLEAAPLGTEGAMEEAFFWAIVDLLDWRTRDESTVVAPAIEALSGFPETDIFRFHDILNEKLHLLDGQRFAEQLGSNCYAPGKGFSVDGFLYARCCVVANGRAFFESVLLNPANMPKEFTFESLLYLPAMAWRLKTGLSEYPYYPEVWAETFSNSEGWPGITPVKERLKNLD